MGAMERVNGIGGFFFKADDADALGQWYVEHLGVGNTPESYDEPVWEQSAGPTVFAPFGRAHWESPYLGPTGWGINFRVDNLDAMVAQLRAAGIDVEVDDEVYPNGRFAQVVDPEGNAVQLWEPAWRVQISPVRRSAASCRRGRGTRTSVGPGQRFRRDRCGRPHPRRCARPRRRRQRLAISVGRG
jgi:glyoxylase I family protein